MSSGMISIAKPLVGDEERTAVERVLASGFLSQGPEVAAFEEEFSHLVGGQHCIAVNSGTSALHLGLLAAGIGPGDEVIVPSFSYAATANSVALAGATPVFADIEPDYFCLDPQAVEASITPRTAAIMPVHLYGHPAAMERIRASAERYGLALMEDAAQAHGASLHGTPVGAFGLVAAFSFYPTKNMTTGEGGLVVTRDDQIKRKVRLLRNHGMERRYENEIVGFNARMTDISAAIGRVQLKKLGAWTEIRRRNAALMGKGLRGVVVPAVAAGAAHVYNQYTIRTDNRDGLQKRLADANVGSAVYYTIPIHRLPSFGVSVELPETDRAALDVLSLPVHPGLTEDEVHRVIEAVNAAVSG
jgi:dTDP-4-amino-4,6-dideoxygalactose transaminase